MGNLPPAAISRARYACLEEIPEVHYLSGKHDAMIADFEKFIGNAGSKYASVNVSEVDRLDECLSSTLIASEFGYDSPEYFRYILSTDLQFKAAADILADNSRFKRFLRP